MRVHFLLALGHAFAGLVESAGQRFHLGAGRGQRGFLGLGALQAGVFVVFQPLDFRVNELDFVVDGVGLGRGGDGVALGAQLAGFLPVAGGLALLAGTEVFFARQRIGSGGSGLLRGFQGGIGLGDLGRESPKGLGKACSLQVEGLQLYQVFDVLLHP